MRETTILTPIELTDAELDGVAGGVFNVSSENEAATVAAALNRQGGTRTTGSSGTTTVTLSGNTVSQTNSQSSSASTTQSSSATGTFTGNSFVDTA